MLSIKTAISVFIIMIILFLTGCATTHEIPPSDHKPKISLYAGEMLDAHAHFLPSVASIDDVISFLDKAKINGAVFFAGDKDLRYAKRRFPQRVIPFLMPLRGDPKTGELLIDDSILDEIEKQIKTGFFKGIGEIPLRLHKIKPYPKGIQHPADSPQMKKLYDIAAKYNIPVNVHVDPGYTDELERALEYNQNTTIIWAHAGYQNPQEIQRLLETHPNLFADLSIILDPYKNHMRQHTSVDGFLKDEWKEFLNSYSHRLMFGTDMNFKWKRYKKTVKVTKHYRRLLGQLSHKAAENIAFRTLKRVLNEDF